MARRGFLAAQYHSIVGWLLNFIPGQWLTRGFEVFFVPGNDINKIVMDLNIYCISLSKQRPADGHLIAFNVRRRAAFFSAAACTSHTFGIPSEPCASKYGLWYIYILWPGKCQFVTHTHSQIEKNPSHQDLFNPLITCSEHGWPNAHMKSHCTSAHCSLTAPPNVSSDKDSSIAFLWANKCASINNWVGGVKWAKIGSEHKPSIYNALIYRSHTHTQHTLNHTVRVHSISVQLLYITTYFRVAGQCWLPAPYVTVDMSNILLLAPAASASKSGFLFWSGTHDTQCRPPSSIKHSVCVRL